MLSSRVVSVSLLAFAVMVAFEAGSTGRPGPDMATPQIRIELVGSESTSTGSIRVSSVARGLEGNPLEGRREIVFALYPEPSGGEPVWVEVQPVEADRSGNYTALLGLMHPSGLPVELSRPRESLWLETRVEGKSSHGTAAHLRATRN